MEWIEIPEYSRWGKSSFECEWNDIEYHIRRLEENNLELDPDFQRGHVWTRKKQIAYVEYILKKGKQSRDLIFNCPGWLAGFEGDMVLVDGKQRLQAARLFMANKLPVFGGVFLKDFTRNGKSHPKVPHDIRFTFHINDLKTQSEVLQLYLDLNAGGVVHSSEEIERVEKLLAIELDKKRAIG